MTWFPIVGRELRVASRRGGTYWSRFQAGLAAMIPAAFLLVAPLPFGSPARMGREMFQILAYLAFISALVTAVRLTADCLSSEKREGTLGFLFLTDLKPFDVVTGKLAATSWTGLYGLLALVPVLALPLLCGGVTLGDVFRLALVLVNSLFFALALAMYVSAVSWHERKAMGMASILIAAITGGFPLAGAALESYGTVPGLAWILRVAHPGFACSVVARGNYNIESRDFWISVFVTHAGGWLFLLLICIVLPRVWQDRPAQGTWLRWRKLCRNALMGSVNIRTAFRRRLLDINPIYWLASREQRTIWYPWLFLASMAALTLFACWALGVKRLEFEALLFVSFFLNWFFKHWIINSACQSFSVDRDKGALELLLATPLSIKSLVAGYGQAMRRQFLAPLATLMAIQLGCFLLALSRSGVMDHRQAFCMTAFLVGQSVFFADVIALVWVGWWSGVVSRNASAAVSTAYFQIMILPWLLVLLGLIPFVGLTYMSQWLAFVALVFWATASLWVDGFFALRARRRLLTGLRDAAVERYSSGDISMSWWKRLGRGAGVSWRSLKQPPGKS